MKGWVSTVGKHSNNKAFTIVELLIVIVVIGILSAIVIAGYGAVVGNANDKAIQSDIIKLSDSVKLSSLDNNVNPSGGATSSNTGDSTILSGITFQPNASSYDQTVANLYYCSGTINGNGEFSIVARSKSGNAFVYSSMSGVAGFSGYTWTSSNNGVAVCTAAGYTAPFTWSYGYNPAPNYGWNAWAFSGPISTNLVTNPSFENDASGVLLYNGGGISRIASATAGSGSYVGRVIKSTAGSGLIALIYPIAYTPNSDISVRLKVRLSPGSTVSNTVSIILPGYNGGDGLGYSTNGGNSAPISSGQLSSSSWTDIVLQGYKTVNDPTLNTVGIGIQAEQAWAANDGVDIDAVMIVKSSTIGGYGDGNTARWSWTGTPNNSTSTGPAL